jgi:predicted hydrocarbon binding protein
LLRLYIRNPNGPYWFLLPNIEFCEPLEKISRDEKKGLILENASRIISFELDTLQASVDRLTKVSGERVTEVLIFQMGSEIGRVSFDHWRDEIKSDSDAGRVFDRVMRLRGWGRCLNLEKQDREDGKIVYVFNTADCPVCSDRKATKPTCDLMRGIVSGWLEGYLGRKPSEVTETTCAAIHGQLCVYELTID